MSPDSFYFYSSLYQFDAEARKTVIAHFNASINDASVRCWYDTDQDAFFVTCPANVGPKADQIFTEALHEFIENEIESAEREERPAHVQRFFESAFGEVAQVGEVEDEETLTEATSSPAKPDKPQSAQIALHQVVYPTEFKGDVKFFTFRTLPTDLLERLLTPWGRTHEWFASNGLTCRATRWSSTSRCLIFNGRVGAPIHLEGSSKTLDFLKSSHLLESGRYVTLYDQRPQPEHPPETQPAQSAREWKFVGNEPRSIRQFLENVGETVQVEPEAKPDIPADAKKFLYRNDNSNATGRARIPVGADYTRDESEDEKDEEDFMDQEKSQMQFKNLMRRQQHDDDDNDDDEDEDVGPCGRKFSSDEDSDEEEAPNFNALLAKSGPHRPVASSSNTTVLPPSTAVRPPVSVVRLPAVPASRSTANMVPANGKSQSSSDVPSSATQSNGAEPPPVRKHPQPTPSSQPPQHGIPSWGRQYWNVDNVGLTSIPANQAAWDHENHSRKQKASRTGVLHRHVTQPSRPDSPQLTGGSSVSASADTTDGRKSRQNPTSPAYASEGWDTSSTNINTAKSYADTKFNAEPWARNNVQQAPASGNLIDTNAPQSRDVKPPPGLEPSSARATENQCHLQGSRAFSFAKGPPPPMGDLIDFSEDINDDPEPKPKPRKTSMSKPLQPATSFRATLAPRDPDEVEERLQSDKESDNRRYTMRQKAQKKGKKGKAPSSEKAKVKAELDLPDAIPPPKQPMPEPEPEKGSPKKSKPKSKSKASKAEKTEKSKTAEEVITPQDVTDSDDSDEHNEQGVAPQSPSIAELLRLAKSHEDAEAAFLDVRFGILLTRVTDQQFRKNEYPPSVFQSKLAEMAEEANFTELLPRMTTSTTDAAYLLDLMPGSKPKARVEYELLVKKTHDGNKRTIRFDQMAPQTFTVGAARSELGVLRMHYPAQVWDAHVTVDKHVPDDQLHDAVRSFIATIQSSPAPSFCAQVPTNSFTIERAYVKRIFTKTLKTPTPNGSSSGLSFSADPTPASQNTIQLLLTEYQDLHLQSVTSPMYNWEANIDPDTSSMIRDARQWWECGLHVPALQQVDAGVLNGVVDTMVANMDGVGWHNQGPWVKGPEPEEGGGVQMMPFW